MNVLQESTALLQDLCKYKMNISFCKNYKYFRWISLLMDLEEKLKRLKFREKKRNCLDIDQWDCSIKVDFISFEFRRKIKQSQNPERKGKFPSYWSIRMQYLKIFFSFSLFCLFQSSEKMKHRQIKDNYQNILSIEAEYS